jgi:hypothetical protein
VAVGQGEGYERPKAFRAVRTRDLSSESPFTDQKLTPERPDCLAKVALSPIDSVSSYVTTVEAAVSYRKGCEKRSLCVSHLRRGRHNKVVMMETRTVEEQLSQPLVNPPAAVNVPSADSTSAPLATMALNVACWPLTRPALI